MIPDICGTVSAMLQAFNASHQWASRNTLHGGLLLKSYIKSPYLATVKTVLLHYTTSTTAALCKNYCFMLLHRNNENHANIWQKMYRTLPSSAVSKPLLINPAAIMDLTIPIGNLTPSATAHHYNTALHTSQSPSLPHIHSN